MGISVNEMRTSSRRNADFPIAIWSIPEDLLKTPKKVEFIGPENRSTKRTKTVCIVSNQQIENSGLPNRLDVDYFFWKEDQLSILSAGYLLQGGTPQL